MPHLMIALVAECLVPKRLQFRWDAPAQARIAESHSHEVSFSSFRLAVHKFVPPVQDGQIISKMNVARLGGELELGRNSDRLDNVKRFGLGSI